MNDNENFVQEIINKLVDDLSVELSYAYSKWNSDFNEKNTLNDWVTYICMYATDAAKIKSNPEEQRLQLLKACGLCISAIAQMEYSGVAPRHYENVVAK